MSAVLVNLAMMLSFCLFVVSLAVGLLNGVSLWPLLFRSVIILTASTLVILCFFRYFNLVLVRFLSERIREHWEMQSEPHEEEGES